MYGSACTGLRVNCPNRMLSADQKAMADVKDYTQDSTSGNGVSADGCSLSAEEFTGCELQRQRHRSQGSDVMHSVEPEDRFDRVDTQDAWKLF
ncbi:unnamed protein product [Schistocephalus solidus]|uniref:Uncharacterized protein n=1 Tax=Schistocephalus solidus TaxID=70667 RepID=A0A183SIA6_SCHSO|nr:unnamed protein product [Schistocephalus solidus]